MPKYEAYFSVDVLGCSVIPVTAKDPKAALKKLQAMFDNADDDDDEDDDSSSNPFNNWEVDHTSEASNPRITMLSVGSDYIDCDLMLEGGLSETKKDKLVEVCRMLIALEDADADPLDTRWKHVRKTMREILKPEKQ